MNTLYLRNDGYAVEPTMEEPRKGVIPDPKSYLGNIAHSKAWEEHLASLPGILVHPSYLENHKVGFLPDDWEMGYEMEYSRHPDESCKWLLISEESYNNSKDHIDCRKVIIPVKERGFTIIETVPRSSNVEDAGEVKLDSDSLKRTWDLLRSSTINMLLSVDESELDKPFVVYGRKSYTRSQLAEEIKNGTPHGIETMQNLVSLTIDLVGRGKKPIPAATHPTQGEDKREEDDFKYKIQVAIAKRENKYPFDYGRTSDGKDVLHVWLIDPKKAAESVYDLVKELTTTPPAKEGERDNDSQPIDIA